MSSEIVFEKVTTPEQIEKLCKVAEEIWHQHFTAIIGAEQVEYMLEKFQSVKAVTEQIKSGYEYFMFRLDGEIIGYTGIHQEQDNRLFLSKLYIRKAYRGNGYARKALNMLEEICYERGLEAIWLTVNRFNDNTIKAYDKMGFRTIEEKKADIGNGFFMDDYIMSKAI